MPHCGECLRSGIGLCRMCQMERKMDNMADEVRFLKHTVDMLCVSDLRSQSIHSEGSSKTVDEMFNSLNWLKMIVDILSSQLCRWSTSHGDHITKLDKLSGRVDDLLSCKDQVQKVIQELNALKTVVSDLSSTGMNSCPCRGPSSILETKNNEIKLAQKPDDL